MKEITICFISWSSSDLSPNQTQELLDKSKENNIQKDISGLFIYNQGSFPPISEGHYDKVASCYDIIFRDQQHFKATPLLENL